MRVVIQRVLSSSVEVEGRIVGHIDKGLLLLIGVQEGDENEDADWLVKKILHLRIFADLAGKMNLSILDISGELLCVSQFTLLADYKKGNRPSFIRAAKAEKSNTLYEYFKKEISKSGIRTEAGLFGAEMKVSLVNDGPVTIVMDSKTRQ